jgi:hypothetical protein
MGKNKKVEQNKLITVEYNVSMHCNACEKTVANTISKCKGICVMSSLFDHVFLT